MSDNENSEGVDQGRTVATRPQHPTRRVASWTRVLFICFLAFCVWFMLDAATLQHNAQVSPVGTRRTVALDILGPFAATSRGLQLSRLVSTWDRMVGHTGNMPGNGTGSITRTLGPKPPTHGQGPPPGSNTSSTVPGATTSTTVPDLRHPTAANPLRVLIIGDSLGIDMGDALQNDLANTGVVAATLDGRVDTGLTRADYFNWPVELQADLKAHNPQIVVIMMGANDPQDFLGPPDVPYGNAAWNGMYSQRVASFMQLASSTGAKVIWVGMPPMQEPTLDAKMSDINAVDMQQAGKQKPPVTFLQSWTVLGTPQGGYTAYINNSAGQAINVRTPDGTHITPDGGEVLSQNVLNELRGTMHINLP
jgi:uncharacterized protein